MNPVRFCVLLCLGISLASCRGNNLSQQKAKATICSDLAGVGTALEQVGALGPSSSVGEAQAAQLTLARSVEALAATGNPSEPQRLEAFRRLLNGFREEVVRTARTSQTLAQGATELQPKAMALLAVRKALSEEMTCKETGPPPSRTK